MSDRAFHLRSGAQALNSLVPAVLGTQSCRNELNEIHAWEARHHGIIGAGFLYSLHTKSLRALELWKSFTTAGLG